MRIGFIADLVTSAPFGVSNSISELLLALARAATEDELVVYVRPKEERLVDRLRSLDASIEIRRAPFLADSRAGRILWEQLRLPARAKSDALDLLHAPGYVMPLRSRVPTLLSVYDILALTHPEFCTRSNRLHYSAALPASIRRARHIAVPSTRVRASLVARFELEEQRISVIPPGIDAGFRQASPPERVRAVLERYGVSLPYVIFVGNREPKKNLARLVEAFTLARRRGTLDGELVLSGGDGWGDVLRDTPPSAHVRALPYVAADALPILVRAARVLALPSLAEGFGIPVIEGMASGVPVVCSNLPSLEDSDAEAAVCVDPSSVDSIAAGLERAWTDVDLRAQLVERGTRAAERFTWDNAAAATWQLYREVVAQ